MLLSILLRRELYVFMINSFYLHAEDGPQMKGTAGPSVVSDLLENCYTQAEYDVIKRVAATSYTGRYLSAFEKLCLISLSSSWNRACMLSCIQPSAASYSAF